MVNRAIGADCMSLSPWGGATWIANCRRAKEFGIAPWACMTPVVAGRHVAQWRRAGNGLKVQCKPGSAETLIESTRRDYRNALEIPQFEQIGVPSNQEVRLGCQCGPQHGQIVGVAAGADG